MEYDKRFSSIMFWNLTKYYCNRGYGSIMAGKSIHNSSQVKREKTLFHSAL